MKRYHIIVTPDLDGRMVLKEYVSEDGEWVKYEDVKKKVEAYDDWVERGIWIARITDPIICNCYEHSQVEMGESCVGITWVCPAHGYKERVI